MPTSSWACSTPILTVPGTPAVSFACPNHPPVPTLRNCGGPGQETAQVYPTPAQSTEKIRQYRSSGGPRRTHTSRPARGSARRAGASLRDGTRWHPGSIAGFPRAFRRQRHSPEDREHGHYNRSASLPKGSRIARAPPSQQSGLPSDASFGLGVQVQGRLARDGDRSWLRRMLVLTMSSPLLDEGPPIPFEHLDRVTNFHRHGRRLGILTWYEAFRVSYRGMIDTPSHLINGEKIRNVPFAAPPDRCRTCPRRSGHATRPQDVGLAPLAVGADDRGAGAEFDLGLIAGVALDPPEGQVARPLEPADAVVGP